MFHLRSEKYYIITNWSIHANHPAIFPFFISNLLDLNICICFVVESFESFGVDNIHLARLFYFISDILCNATQVVNSWSTTLIFKDSKAEFWNSFGGKIKKYILETINNIKSFPPQTDPFSTPTPLLKRRRSHHSSKECYHIESYAILSFVILTLYSYSANQRESPFKNSCILKTFHFLAPKLDTPFWIRLWDFRSVISP